MRLISANVRAGATLAAGLFFVLGFIIQGVFFIRANAPTYDEAMHIAAGYSYLATRDFRLEPQNPPLVKELLALPLFLVHHLPFNPDPKLWRDGVDFYIGQDFLYRSALPADQMLLLSRGLNLFLGTLLVALVGWWAYRLWGNYATLLAIAPACFEPNLVAHSSLVTTDTGATLFIFLTVYLLWEYIRIPRWWLLSATGIAAGMALVSKFSTVLLFPIIGLLVTVYLFIDRAESALLPLRRPSNPKRRKVFEAIVLLVVIFLFAVATIPIFYFFQGFEPWLFGLRRFITLAQEGQRAFSRSNFLSRLVELFRVCISCKNTNWDSFSDLGHLSFVSLRQTAQTPRRTVLALTRRGFFPGHDPVEGEYRPASYSCPSTLSYSFSLARSATLEPNRRWLKYLLIGAPLALTAISSLRIAPHQIGLF